MTEKEICALLGKTSFVLLKDGKWGQLTVCKDPAHIQVNGEPEPRKIPVNELVSYNIEDTLLYEI